MCTTTTHFNRPTTYNRETEMYVLFVFSILVFQKEGDIVRVDSARRQRVSVIQYNTSLSVTRDRLTLVCMYAYSSARSRSVLRPTKKEKSSTKLAGKVTSAGWSRVGLYIITATLTGLRSVWSDLELLPGCLVVLLFCPLADYYRNLR